MTQEASQTPTPGTDVVNNVYEDTDLTATEWDDITGGVAGELYIVEIDARNNPGENVYVRFYDSADATPASDTADVTLVAKKGTKQTYIFREFDDETLLNDTPGWSGIPFSTGLCVCACQEAGTVGAVTDPSGTVGVKIGTKE